MFYSTKALCRLFNVTPKTIRRWELLGKLPAPVRLGGKRWSREAIDNMLARITKRQERATSVF